MKKMSLIAIVLSLALLFAACGTTPNQSIGQTIEPTEAPTTEAPTETPTEAPTETPTEAPTEEPSEAPSSATVQGPTRNYASYTNQAVPAPSANQITVTPYNVYWDGNVLVAECYIVSGLDTTAYNFELKRLAFETPNGMVADAYFGALEGLVIQPYTYATWTFSFSPDVITLYDDLNTLKWYSSIGYSH